MAAVEGMSSMRSMFGRLAGGLRYQALEFSVVTKGIQIGIVFDPLFAPPRAHNLFETVERFLSAIQNGIEARDVIKNG